jgi:aspartate-semialdehyde dehydrogenase
MSRNGKRNVAIVGATGAVGEVLLEVLAERRFPVGELRPLASERSAGTTVRFNGADVPVELARPAALDGADFVFFAATGTLSRDLAPEAARRGAVAIDKSSTWRMDPKVPLVVPEVNPQALERHEGIVSCPNCTTIGFVMALEPIRRAAGLRSVVVTTLQAVSGAGKPGIDELEQQMAAAARGERVAPRTFASPIAYNVVPLCETFRDDGYSTEEAKLLFETRKVMDLPDLDVSMTCVRVPVPVGHSASMLIETNARSRRKSASRAGRLPGRRRDGRSGEQRVPDTARRGRTRRGAGRPHPQGSREREALAVAGLGQSPQGRRHQRHPDRRGDDSPRAAVAPP